MGAEEFEQIGEGANLQDAFIKAREAAAWENGHGGYTGTLAEKDSYLDLTSQVAHLKTPQERIDAVQADAARFNFDKQAYEPGTLWEKIQDKWGPAGAIELGDGRWLFFGWASS
jgi:hypothetical protein